MQIIQLFFSVVQHGNFPQCIKGKNSCGAFVENLRGVRGVHMHDE